jgi:hypothetical protein
MREPSEYMSMLRFRGGPWDGFVIDHGEHARPRDSLDPAGGHLAGRGHYLLNAWASAYVWADGTIVANGALATGLVP